WRVNFYELDGGTEGETFGPKEGDDDFPELEAASSWLNLTRLGFYCKMHPIPAHSKESRDQTSRPGLAKKPPKPARYLISKSFMLYADIAQADANDLVAAIEDITADSAKADDLAQGQFGIQILSDDTLVREILPSDIDGAFMKDWRRAINAFEPPVFAAPSL